jgi:hypothetical protein
MIKVLALVAFVSCVAFASYAVFGPPPTRALAAKGWVCAAVMLAIASVHMR